MIERSYPPLAAQALGIGNRPGRRQRAAHAQRRKRITPGTTKFSRSTYQGRGLPRPVLTILSALATQIRALLARWAAVASISYRQACELLD